MEKVMIYGALFALPVLWLGAIIVISFNIIGG